MDKPAVNRTEHGDGDPAAPPPPPLFRYCTTRDHFDIPFPDWSFWGWYERHPIIRSSHRFPLCAVQ
jgi:protein glucosyltransferase